MLIKTAFYSIETQYSFRLLILLIHEFLIFRQTVLFTENLLISLQLILLTQILTLAVLLRGKAKVAFKHVLTTNDVRSKTVCTATVFN